MVRIWCVPVEKLDRQHLLGEHHELHVIWNTIMRKRAGIKCGFMNHPEVIRFEKNIMQLVWCHNEQVDEMTRRGYKHNSPLGVSGRWAKEYVYSDEEMKRDLEILKQRQITI